MYNAENPSFAILAEYCKIMSVCNVFSLLHATNLMPNTGFAVSRAHHSKLRTAFSKRLHL
jgi:hypothetical protein